MAKIAVIIATYQAEPWIRPCLDSVLVSNIPVSVYIVDNASKDNTVAILQKEYAGKIFLHQSKKNLGFGKANNIAIKQAYHDGADYFFLLNQDAFIAKDTLGILTEVFESAPLNKYGVLSPLHLNGKGDALDFGFDSYLQKGDSNVYEAIKNKQFVASIIDVPFVNAAGWMISRYCIEKVGLFNPLFFHYGEDDNYGNRLSFHNLKIGIVQKALLWHNRIYKPYSTTPKATKQLFLRITLLQLSNPNNTFSVYNRMNLYLRQAIKGLFTGEFSTAKENFLRLYWIITIINKPVAQYLQLTLKGGYVFFQHTTAFTGKVINPEQ